MNPKNTHKRFMLNKNQSGQVDYCEECNVVELEVGPVSLRLHEQDLELFSELVQDAELRLRYYKTEKAKFETQMVKVGGIH